MIYADQFRQLKKEGAVLMVENRPSQKILAHATLILGIAIVSFQIYIALVCSIHKTRDVMTTVQGWFGNILIENYSKVLKSGKGGAAGLPVVFMMWNSEDAQGDG